MTNRFIFSLRFSNQVFVKFIKLSLAMVIFMSLFRTNLFFLHVFHTLEEFNPLEIGQSFVVGFRFDLLVFGFILAPLYLMVTVQAFVQAWPKGVFKFYKAYFAFVWTVICAITFMDYFYFCKHGQRMRFEQYQDWTFATWWEDVQTLKPDQVWVFCVITLVLLVLGYMLIRAIKFGEWKDEFSPRHGSLLEAAGRLLWPLIFIVLAARGTVEPHHLALEHSKVSANPIINDMALNAVWCFDK